MDKNLSQIQRQFLAQSKEEQTAQLKSMAATLCIKEYERMKRNERWGMTFEELLTAIDLHDLVLQQRERERRSVERCPDLAVNKEAHDMLMREVLGAAP